MARNYENEMSWRKEKYCEVRAYIDKQVGDKLKEILKAEGKTMASFLTDCAKSYINEKNGKN